MEFEDMYEIIMDTLWEIDGDVMKLGAKAKENIKVTLDKIESIRQVLEEYACELNPEVDDDEGE